MRRQSTPGYCTQDGFFTGTATVAAVSNCTLIGKARERANSRSRGDPPLVVTGCARGIAAALANHTIPYLDALLAAAPVHRLAASVLVFHDDPTDNATLAALREWASREVRVQVILSDMGNRGERIQRLTLCRNVLLGEAAHRLQSVDDGFVAQLDLDCRHGQPEALLFAVGKLRHKAMQGGLSGMSVEGGLSGAPFGVITANNVGAYRDMWALRSSALGMNYDCFWDFKQMRLHGNCKKHRLFVHPRASPFAIEAGFNGMAIQTRASLLAPRVAACRYTNESLDLDTHKPHVVSEHVPYQQCLVRHGVSVGLDPGLLTYCHDWNTRHDAKRAYYLSNGTLLRLHSRHTKPDPGWMPPRWLK